KGHFAPREFLLCGLQYSCDRPLQLLPTRQLLRQLLLASRRQPVILRALVVVRSLPLGRNPFLLFKAVQRRIQGAGVHLQDLARARADSHADAVAVLGSPLQRLQDQQVERALQKLDAVLIAFLHFFHLDDSPRLAVLLWGCSLSTSRGVDNLRPCPEAFLLPPLRLHVGPPKPFFVSRLS